MAGEFDFIDWIQQQQKPGGRIVLPAGDDMAVLNWNGDELLLVAVDQVLDGVHFNSSIHTPRQIGRKVMNRNLSDCAAMACLPAGALACVALPRGCGLDHARQLYLGMREAGDAFDCPLVGGDTGSWDGKLVASVTIFGRSAGIEPIRRSGARPGDWIYVTGPLGGSILGRHMGFVPRIALARDLAGNHKITAMIDISDGLSRDLGHICRASNVGADIESRSIPVHRDAVSLSASDGRPALQHALHDGEDHELLFTSSQVISLPHIVRIGRIAAQHGVRLDGQDLPPAAWEHTL